MNVNRLWGLGTALVIVVILGLGWVLGVQPRFAQAAAADEERQTVELNNQTQQIILNDLKAKAENIEQYRAELATLRATSIPGAPDRKELLLYFERVAKSAKVGFTGASLGEPSVYTVGEGEPITAAPTGALASNLYVMTATVNVSGKPGDVLNFVKRLQEGNEMSGRLILIPTLNLSFGSDASAVTIEAYVFFIDDPNVPPSATPIAPAPGAEEEPEPEEPPAPEDTPAAEETPAPESSATPAPAPSATP